MKKLSGADQEERAEAKRRSIAETVARRARADLPVLRRLPEVFETADVGNACRSEGRHWSEHMGVLTRALRFGRIEPIEHVARGRRTYRRWRKMALPCDPGHQWQRMAEDGPPADGDRCECGGMAWRDRETGA